MDTGHLRKARNPSPGMGPDQGQLTGKNPRRSARRDHRSPPPSSPWGLRFPRASEENSPRQQTTRQREGPVSTSVPVRLVHVNTRPAHASTGRRPARPTSAWLQGTAPRAAVLPATRPKAAFHQSGRKSVGKCSSLPTFQWGDSEVPSTQLRAGTPGGGSPRSPSAHLSAPLTALSCCPHRHAGACGLGSRPSAAGCVVASEGMPTRDPRTRPDSDQVLIRVRISRRGRPG